MTPKPKHGGTRPGAGRKKTGAKTLTRTIAAPPAVWERFEAGRGTASRGAHLARILDAATPD